MDDTDRVVAVLMAASTPLGVSEVAARAALEYEEVDRVLWGSPERFAWQPGHKWVLFGAKDRPRHGVATLGVDARPGLLSALSNGQLRAITLSSGLVLKVSRRPLDSDALFSVRSAGSDIRLVINSTHEVFGEFPMPFEEGVEDSPYKRLLELLLEAWAVYEDGLMPGPSKRTAEDARLVWGRRALEIHRDR
jgi:hypothetical protein